MDQADQGLSARLSATGPEAGGAFSRYVVATYRLGEAEGKDSQSGGSPGRPLWQLGRLSDTAPEWVAWKEALAYLDIRTGAPRTEAPLCLWETALRDLGRAQAVPTMDRQVMSQREQSHRQKWLSSVQMAELSQDVPRVEVDF